MEPSIFELALAAGNRTDFELFGQAILQSALGISFEPTGGLHDGGQDGFLRPIAGKPDRYAQISMQEDYRAKISATIHALRKGGREITQLTYVSHLSIPTRDLVEADFEKKTGVTVRIFDQRRLWLTVATTVELESIFKDRYATVLHGLKSINDHIQKRLAQTERLSVLVYLENHEKSEPGQSELLPLAVDATIFMALKDTDPDNQNFRTEEEIILFVEDFFPAVKSRASQLVPARLAHLRTKAGNPRIRYHNASKYALPFEVRSEFSSQNALLRRIIGDSLFDIALFRCGHI